MDEFLRRCKEEYCLGLERNEKSWLRSFYYDVEKCIRQNESDAEFAEVCFFALQKINQHRSEHDEKEAFSPWLLNHQVFSLDTLMKKHKDIFSGFLVCNAAKADNISATVEPPLSGHPWGLRMWPLTGGWLLNTGYSSISRIPSILLGYLTIHPKSAKPPTTSGTLYIEDNYTAVVCEITNPDRWCLDKLVMISEWNYVPQSSLPSVKPTNKCSANSERLLHVKDVQTGYIEISGKCIPIKATTRTAHDNKAVEFLTIEQIQEDRSSAVNLNICGNIFALSPVHSMSIGKPFFLVKLSCIETNLTTSVVVQGDQFMFWHNFLQVGEAYVFRNLRETTMNKGTRNERRILASTRHSEFQKYQPGITVRSTRSIKRLQSEEEDKTEPKRLKIDKQGEDLGPMKSKQKLATSRSVTAQEPLCRDVAAAKPKPPVNMSYTGVITKCLKPEAGVYELDEKIRLYINHQPCVNLGRGLRVGAHVTVHNVHLCRKGKRVLGLCCCTQSTVQIIKFSSLASPWKPFSPCESPLALLGQNLTLADYVDLLEMCDKVIEKFSPSYRTSQLVAYSARQNRKEMRDARRKESVLEQLLSFIRNSSVSNRDLPRNIYDEFFEVPHECHPNRISELQFPWLPTVKEFLDAVNQKWAEEPWLNGQSKHITATQEKEEWMYKILTQDCFNHPVLLAGLLRSSSKTGGLRLVDQTGEVSCIVTPVDQQSADHDCVRNCCKTNCPYAQTWHSNAMIQISKFELITEKFRSSDLSQASLSEDASCAYLQFSFDNAKILISKDTCNQREKGGSGRKKETDEIVDQGLKNVSDAKDREFMCKILFMVRNCELPTLRKLKEEVCYPCGVEIKIVAVQKSDVENVTAGSKSTTSERDDSCPSSYFSLSEFQLQRKNSALKLVKKSLCWSRFLHPGCFYIITEKVPDEESSWIFRNGNLELLISVSSNMELERICWCESCRLVALSTDSRNSKEVGKVLDDLKEDFLRNDQLCTVDSILSDTAGQQEESENSMQPSRSSSMQISFRGVIVSRELRQSDSPSQRLPNGLVEVPKFGPIKVTAVKDLQLGFTLLSNAIILLRVQDLRSPNTIAVYLDLRRTSYIYGMLPGTFVQFRRFVRKFSRTRNMYCTFEACSSIIVERRTFSNITDVHLNPRPPDNVTASTSAEENTTVLPNRYFIDLIRNETQGNFIQTISRVRCRVTAVQKASLRWLCKRCGELVFRNECTSGCYSSAGYKFNAEARCVVEDGTGEAQLYVYDEVVQTLLKLSSQQWRHLQDLTMRTGELLYQRLWRGGISHPQLNQGNQSSRETEAKMTLENYCCSSKLQRLVVLHCKLFRFSKSAASKTDQGYESRSIHLGLTEHSTLVLPKLLLRAVSITDVRPADEIRQLLQDAKA